MAYFFEPRAVVSTPVVGSRMRFPVGRIYCVGRNYAAHAREMGRDPDREPPFFFLKDADALVEDGAILPYPSQTTNYHHEIELVIAIGKHGLNVPAESASDLIFGYAVGLDMTRRDLQLAARDQGRPWDTGKNFPFSAPMGAIHPVAALGVLTRGAIRLDVNGETRQSADLSELIWSVTEIIEHLSRFYCLTPGDLIFTGTPAGVGPVMTGDRLAGSIDGLGSLSVTIGDLET